MFITKLDEAKNIVIENYPNSSNMSLTLSLLLESSKALESYRPFFVAANMIFSEYRQLTQAETVKFQYNLDNIKALLATQKALDNELSDIKEGFNVDDLLIQITNMFQASFYTNGMGL